MSVKTIPLKSLLLLAGSAIALAGCKIDNRPLLARGEPEPAAVALPQPGPIDPNTGAPVYAAYPSGGELFPAQAYPYAERAYALDRAFYDAPPDYGFYYGDEEPWVWETADDDLMFAEPYGDDYRFYYYEPGYDYPYFVRTADYGYAFGPDGALIALFDAAGALIGADQYDRYYPEARQYWTRGYDMRQDYGRAPRQAVNPQVWSRQGPVVARAEQTWINAPATQPSWRQWRASDAGRAVVQRVDTVRPARAAGPGPGAPRGGFRGFNAAPAPTTMAAAAPPDRRGRFAPQGQPRFEQRRFEQPGAMARNEGGRFGPRATAPSVQEHGRWASARAPALQTAPMPRAEARAPHGPPAVQPHGGGREWHGGGAPARFAQAAPPQVQPHGGGHEWHGGGGPTHVAQAASPPVQPHGGGGGGGWHGGGQPHAQPAPQAQPPQQAHPGGGQPQGGGGQPHGQGGGNGHGQGGGNGHDHKHGG